jgi:hypothetical protein
MGDINKKERLSLVENKRSIGLFDKLKANADKQGRSINDYAIIVLSKSIEQKGENTLTFTPQALFEISEEIVKKCKKCMNQDPSMSENVMWDSLTTEWLDWIEDKSLEALKTN